MSLTIFIRSPSTFSERKFPASLTIDALKVRIPLQSNTSNADTSYEQAKLEHVTGIPYAAQVLNVFPNPDAAEKGEGGVPLGEGVLGDVVKEWQCISVSRAGFGMWCSAVKGRSWELSGDGQIARFSGREEGAGAQGCAHGLYIKRDLAVQEQGCQRPTRSDSCGI